MTCSINIDSNVTSPFSYCSAPYQGGQVYAAPQPGPMYSTPGGAPGGNPWGGQYPYQQAAAATQGQAQADPNHQAAWAAYYQQLYAAQAQAQAQQGGQR